MQIYLPDLGYALERPARELSCAGDYFPVAAAAIDEMLRQVGAVCDRRGRLLMKSGVIIRHLVLPGQLEKPRRSSTMCPRTSRRTRCFFSLMSQYTPQPGASGLARRLNHAEYRAAVRYMTDCGITDGFCQELSSAKEEYTPAFDLQGI